MKIQVLMLIVATQAILSVASAAELTSEGKLTVLRPFTVVRTRSLNDPKAVDKEEINLSPGTYGFEMGNWEATDVAPCLPPFCGQARSETPVVSFVLQQSKLYYGVRLREASVDFNASSQYLRDGTSFYGSQSSGQSFNFYAKTSESVRKTKSRVETQECSVKAYCHDGYYGERCEYAMGTQKVRLHDEITTRTVRVKIVGAGNELLATYVGTRSGDPDPQTESAGRCHLNVPQ